MHPGHAGVTFGMHIHIFLASAFDQAQHGRQGLSCPRRTNLHQHGVGSTRHHVYASESCSVFPVGPVAHVLALDHLVMIAGHRLLVFDHANVTRAHVLHMLLP